jgi:hypothetical protein
MNRQMFQLKTNPPAQKAQKKYLHARKEILGYQHKLDEKGHADNYYIRLQRLKGEEIEKLPKLTNLLDDLRKKVAALKLEGLPSKRAIDKIESVALKVELLSKIETVEKFEREEILFKTEGDGEVGEE